MLLTFIYGLHFSSHLDCKYERKVLFFEDPIEIPTGLEFMIVVGSYQSGTQFSGYTSLLLIRFLKTAIFKDTIIYYISFKC